jgi:hypothetical protein
MVPLQLSYSVVFFYAMNKETKNLCKLCLQEKKLIKAHIIPEGFVRPLWSGKLAPELHTNSPGKYPKRIPIGVYDPSILCSECDQKMAPWDDYAQELFLHQFSDAQVLQLNQQQVGWRIESFDYRRLKLFFVSVLWRASVSQHEFYKRISVGPFEGRLRTMILDRDPGGSQDFAVILARFGDSDIAAMLDPHPEKFESVSFIRFYLTGILAYIKVDQRPTPSVFADCRVQESGPLIVLSRRLHNSRDALVMRDLAESAIAKKRRRSREGTD